MIKYKIAALLFFLTIGVANAEVFTVQRTLTCDNLKTVIDLLAKYKEKVVWQSQSDKGLFSILTVNQETQTWTIVITNGTSACLVDSGLGFTLKGEPVKEPSKGPVNRITM